MRILFLNKAPKNAARYDVTGIEALLNSYDSPGMQVEVGVPDNFAGSCVALGMSQSPKTHPHADLAADEFIKEA